MAAGAHTQESRFKWLPRQLFVRIERALKDREASCHHGHTACSIVTAAQSICQTNSRASRAKRPHQSAAMAVSWNSATYRPLIPLAQSQPAISAARTHPPADTRSSQSSHQPVHCSAWPPWSCLLAGLQHASQSCWAGQPPGVPALGACRRARGPARPQGTALHSSCRGHAGHFVSRVLPAGLLQEHHGTRSLRCAFWPRANQFAGAPLQDSAVTCCWPGRWPPPP